MKPEFKKFLKHSSIELLVYSGLVVGYFFLVLHLLGDWLAALFKQSRPFYAVVALVLIVGQGMVLELLTSVLLRWIGSGRRR